MIWYRIQTDKGLLKNEDWNTLHWQTLLCAVHHKAYIVYRWQRSAGCLRRFSVIVRSPASYSKWTAWLAIRASRDNVSFWGRMNWAYMQCFSDFLPSIRVCYTRRIRLMLNWHSPHCTLIKVANDSHESHRCDDLFHIVLLNACMLSEFETYESKDQNPQIEEEKEWLCARKDVLIDWPSTAGMLDAKEARKSREISGPLELCSLPESKALLTAPLSQNLDAGLLLIVCSALVMISSSTSQRFSLQSMLELACHQGILVMISSSVYQRFSLQIHCSDHHFWADWQVEPWNWRIISKGATALYEMTDLFCSLTLMPNDAAYDFVIASWKEMSNFVRWGNTVNSIHDVKVNEGKEWVKENLGKSSK